MEDSKCRGWEGDWMAIHPYIHGDARSGAGAGASIWGDGDSLKSQHGEELPWLARCFQAAALPNTEFHRSDV